MNRDELLLNIKAGSFNDAVCLTDIQNEEDKKLYEEKGYYISFTEDEFKKMFPGIPSANIYYFPSIANTAYYFNKDTLAVVPFYAEFYANGLFTKDRIKDFSIAISERERQVADRNFVDSIIVLQDAMRIEYFEKLIDKYEGIPNLYKLFFDFYRISDYGFGRLSQKVIDVVLKAKNDKDREKTRKALQNKPDILKIYRGGSIDESTPADKAYSWSLNINTANFFACRLGTEGSYLAVGEVEKDKVIDAFMNGDEKEIVVDPKNVKIIDEIDIKGLPFCEKILPEISTLYLEYKEVMLGLDFAQDSSVHGKEHEARVLLLCLTLGHMLKLPMSDLDTLAVAAIFHDTQRVNDIEDSEHGLYSRQYYEEETENPDPIVSFLIEYHSRPDKDGFKAIDESRILSENKSKAERLYKVFKDADALDRVRFGLRDLNLKFLRIPESKQLTLVARIYFEQVKI